MAVTVVGTGSAAATSVAIPAHQAGDLILVAARGGASTPTVPAAGGTVPTWTTLQSGVANSISLTVVAAVAAAGTTTTGVFTNATQIAVIVLRGDVGNQLLAAAARSAVGNGNNTQTIVYPALTFTDLDGSSFGVRVGTRGVADSEVANPPSGWTNQRVQPAGASALLAIHTLAGVTVSPGSASVTTAGTNAAYRAVTIEVQEVAPPSWPSSGIVDDFNRANQQPPGAQWAGSWSAGWQVVSNQLRNMAGGWDGIYWNAVTPANQEAYITVVAVGADTKTFQIHLRRDNAADTAYLISISKVAGGGDNLELIRRVAAADTVIASEYGVREIAAGDLVGMSAIGSTIKFWHRPVGGSLTTVLQATDATIASGQVGLFSNDPGWILDDLRADAPTAPVMPGGVASAAAFGAVTPKATRTVSVSGVASAAAFSSTVIGAAVTVPVAGIASAQAFGAVAAFVPGAGQVVQVSGVFPPFWQHSITGQVVAGDGHLVGGQPGNQFGAISYVVISAQVRPVGGVGTAQTFGAVTAKATISKQPAGLGSAQAFGALVFRTAVTRQVSGLGSAQQFGTVSARSVFVRTVAGIPSAQAFSTVTIIKGTVTSPNAGLPSAQAFGTLRFALRFPLAGVASAQAFGAIRANLKRAVAGVPSAQAFGAISTRTGHSIPVSGIPSAQAFGTIRPAYSIAVPGVGSAQNFGLITFTTRTRVLVGGVPSAQAFGRVKPVFVWLLPVVPRPETSVPVVCTPITNGGIDCIVSPFGSICGMVICGDGHLAGGDTYFPGLPPDANVILKPVADRSLVLQPVGDR